MTETRKFFVYIVKCSDGTYYTGFTHDVASRVHRHNAGKGAKYTRARLPVELLYSKQFETYLQAVREEARIKRLTRRQKEEIVNSMVEGLLIP